MTPHRIRFIRAFLCLAYVSLGSTLWAQIGDAKLAFTNVDVPGAGYTIARGINKAGRVVGNYGQSAGGASHGFLYQDGTFTYFDYPGEGVTVPTGINDAGVIVGYAGTGPIIAFLFDGTTFTPISDGNDIVTYGYGISNSGTVVGSAGNLNATQAFEMRNGRFQTIKFPGSYVYSYATGINRSGEVVGFTVNGGYTWTSGRVHNVSVPGATLTQPLGLNDAGTIVGAYTLPQGCTCAFVDQNGKYSSFQYPAAKATYASGINTPGQIVGSYTLDFNTTHSFLTSPVAQQTLTGLTGSQ